MRVGFAIGRTDDMQIRYPVLLLVGLLSACNSTQYYYNPTKTVSAYTADYEECRRLAYVDNRDIRLGGFLIDHRN